MIAGPFGKRRGLGALLLVTVASCGAPAEEPPFRPPEPVVVDSFFRYPVELWDQGVEGETIVLVHVSSSGRVDSASVAVSSGYAQFDSAAMAGARRLQFTPARRGDQRVDGRARLPVRFGRPQQSLGTRAAAPTPGAEP